MKEVRLQELNDVILRINSEGNILRYCEVLHHEIPHLLIKHFLAPIFSQQNVRNEHRLKMGDQNHIFESENNNPFTASPIKESYFYGCYDKTIYSIKIKSFPLKEKYIESPH